MRWYDPATGRWISKDPILLAGGLNLYAFCGNDPMNGSDPTGLTFWSSFGQGIVHGAVGAAIIVGGAAVIVTVGVPVAVVTSGVAIIGAIGGGITLGSIISNPSADNIGYNLGALTGGAIVDGASGRALATRLSLPDYQPALGWAGWNPVRDASQVWRYDPSLTFSENWWSAMGTGPNPLSAAGAVAGGGSGLALPAGHEPDSSPSK